MTDRLITRKQLAAMLGTTPGVAVSIMAEHGVHPIDWGAGRSRGYRWPESRVRDVILEMYSAAQPKPKKPHTPRPVAPSVSLADMPVADVFNLTTCQRVQ